MQIATKLLAWMVAPFTRSYRSPNSSEMRLLSSSVDVMTPPLSPKVLRNSSCLALRAPHHKRYAAKTTLTVQPFTIMTGYARPHMTIRCLLWESENFILAYESVMLCKCALKSSRNAGQRIALCLTRPERPPTRILPWILVMYASTTFVLSAAFLPLSSKRTRTGQTSISIPSTLMIKIWTPQISLSSHLQPRRQSPLRTSNLAMRKITMAATSSSISRKQRRISQPAYQRMALNTTRPNLTLTTSRSVSRMAPSIFMMPTASTCTGSGGMRIITTCHTRTIGEINILMSTATQIAATVPIRHPTHRSSKEASKSTPSFLLRAKSYSRLPSQHLPPL